jgi:tetratricopeptide (TPR) repeat protein
LDKPIAVNSFFSTSFSESEATDFAKRGIISDKMQRVLIHISLNTSIKNMVSFAEIEHRVRYTDEREVLFDCNALFNITHVEYDRYSEMWLVKMVAISKNSINQHSYLEILRETILQNHSPMVAFGIILAQGFDRREQALNYFNRILRTYPSSHKDIPDVLQQRAILYEEMGDQSSAFRDYKHALDIHSERIRESLSGIASINSHIGVLQSTQFNFPASLASHQEALNLYDQLYGTMTDHWTKAKVNENIGLVYYKNGSIVEANEYFMRAWDMYNRVLPSKHPSLIQLLGYIGGVHEAINDSILAVEYFRRQLNWTEKALPLDHPSFITCLDSVSRVHTKFDQTSNITDLFSEYLENVKEILGERHPVIPRLQVTVASLFESTQPTKAIELYEQALSINEQWTKMNQDIVYTCHKNLVQLYRKTKNMNDALKHAMETYTYQQKISLKKQDHSLEADELYTIGSIFLEMNQSTYALQYLTKALTIYQLRDHPNVQTVLTSIIEAANQSRSHSE